MPRRLPSKININNEKTKEKYFIPDLPILSPIIFAINSYEISTRDWARDGIIAEFFRPMAVKRIIKTTVVNIASEELVNDMSNPINSNGINLFISNCDKGLAIL